MSDDFDFPEQVFHYTSLATLACIVANKSIRFGRLDGVNDTEEETSLRDLDFMSRNYFISCWTTKHEEKIPLWHIYSGGMKGVRISLPGNMFEWKKVTQPDKSKFNIDVHGEGVSPVADQMFNSDGILMPASLLDHSNFGRPVDYCDNPEVGNYSTVSVSKDRFPYISGTFNIKDLAFRKKKHWSFEEEYRYRLVFMPCIPSSPTNYETSGWMVPHNRRYFDVPLSKDALERMEVMLGPLTTFSDEVVAGALLEKYCPTAKLLKSSLSVRNTNR